ncbi:MAG: phosphatase PAP2 family protein [Bryobacteraceae bacterium]
MGDGEILTTVLKDAPKRVSPAGIPPSGNRYDSWFESKGSLFKGNGSFPSGHTIAAFSIATVIARRYGNHRWVPYAAYGMAALVCQNDPGVIGALFLEPNTPSMPRAEALLTALTSGKFKPVTGCLRPGAESKWRAWRTTWTDSCSRGS